MPCPSYSRERIACKEQEALEKKSYYDTAETAPKIWAHQNSLCKANPANIKYISMEMFRMMKLNR
ncbi:MAG TPA: hypothetical protein DHV55_11060 [Clostridiaceae bacterium]|nr:hypothetical protein [Clostridiaceae bacterium]